MVAILKILYKFKYLLLGLIAVLVGVIVYMFTKKDDQSEVVTAGENPNFPTSTLTTPRIKLLVTQLFDAMDGFGTDEAMIFSALEGLNPNDYKKLYDAWGNKPYDVITGGEAPFEFISQGGDLTHWLAFELSVTDINKIKHLFQ